MLNEQLTVTRDGIWAKLMDLHLYINGLQVLLLMTPRKDEANAKRVSPSFLMVNSVLIPPTVLGVA